MKCEKTTYSINPLVAKPRDLVNDATSKQEDAVQQANILYPRATQGTRDKRVSFVWVAKRSKGLQLRDQDRQ